MSFSAFSQDIDTLKKDTIIVLIYKDFPFFKVPTFEQKVSKKYKRKNNKYLEEKLRNEYKGRLKKGAKTHKN